MSKSPANSVSSRPAPRPAVENANTREGRVGAKPKPTTANHLS
jgi:hypothetical protein